MANFTRPSSLMSGPEFRSHNLQKGLTSIVDRCDLVASDIDDLPIRFFTETSVCEGSGHVLDVRESAGLVSLAVYQGRLVPEDPIYPYSENVSVGVGRILSRTVHVVRPQNGVVQPIGSGKYLQHGFTIGFCSSVWVLGLSGEVFTERWFLSAVDRH